MAIDMLKAAEAKIKLGGLGKKPKKNKTDNMPMDTNGQTAGPPKMDAGMNDIPPPLDVKLENALDLMTDIQQGFPENSEPANQIAGMIKQLTAILTKVSGETQQPEEKVPEGPVPPPNEMATPGGERSAFPASPTGAGGVSF